MSAPALSGMQDAEIEGEMTGEADWRLRLGLYLAIIDVFVLHDSFLFF
jgi:hypothetical protein